MSKNLRTTVSVKIYNSEVEKIKKEALDCLWKTIEALHTDLVQSQTMPFKTGTMQNTATYAQKDDDRVSLHTNTPYANRLYYHPEYNFSKDENPNAQAYWLETYIDGNKKDFVIETYEKFLKEGV